MKILNPIVLLGLTGSLCAPLALSAQNAPTTPESEPPAANVCQPGIPCPSHQARMPDNRGPRGGQFQGGGGFQDGQAPMTGPQPPQERQAYGPQHPGPRFNSPQMGEPRGQQADFGGPGQGMHRQEMSMQAMNAQGPEAAYAYGEPQQRPHRPGQPSFAQGQANGPQGQAFGGNAQGPQGPGMGQQHAYGPQMGPPRQGSQGQACANGQCPSGQQRGPAAQGQNRGPGGPQAPWQGQQPGVPTAPANTQEPDWGSASQPQG